MRVIWVKVQAWPTVVISRFLVTGYMWDSKNYYHEKTEFAASQGGKDVFASKTTTT